MRKAILIVILFAASSIYSQNELRKVDVDSIYHKGLAQRMDLYLSSGYKYFELNENTKNLKQDYESGVIKFRNADELISISIKEKRTLNVYRMTHQIISKDTVDLNFSDVSYIGKRKITFNHGLKFKTAKILIYCAGTDAYKPDIRFVFEHFTNRWRIIENSFLKVQ